MSNQSQGLIDIAPPLAWSEVQPLGFMVMNVLGYPVPPVTGLVQLNVVEQLVDRPEGTLHRFMFDGIGPATPDITTGQRTVFRDQVAAIVTAFPTHTFGGVSRNIRFRGDQLDDQWRIRLDNDGTVKLQTADLTWTTV